MYFTVAGKCSMEIRECREILSEYNVPDNITDIILDMIKEAYFQLNDAYASGRAMERILYELIRDKDDKAFHMKYMQYVQEENFKFPFVLDYDDVEENEILEI